MLFIWYLVSWSGHNFMKKHHTYKQMQLTVIHCLWDTSFIMMDWVKSNSFIEISHWFLVLLVHVLLEMCHCWLQNMKLAQISHVFLVCHAHQPSIIFVGFLSFGSLHCEVNDVKPKQTFSIQKVVWENQTQCF